MGCTKHPCVLATEVKGSHSPKASAKKPRDFMRDRARRPIAVGSWHAPKKFLFSSVKLLTQPSAAYSCSQKTWNLVGKDHQWQQGALVAVVVVVLQLQLWLLLLVLGDSYKG